MLYGEDLIKKIRANVRVAIEKGEVATLENGTCSHCGRTGLPSNSNFCDKCGYTFVTEETAKDMTEERKR